MRKMTINKLPDQGFDVQEAVNQLRVNLGFTGENIKTIMFTSSLPNEGKSFVSLNLWKNLAAVGNKTILIDTDIRNSQMRNQYEFVAENGLVGVEHYLSGKMDINDVIYSTNYRNGYIIPVSTNVIDPTTLLESNRFKAMIEGCKEKFDYLIIDTPPIGSVADALNIAKFCDGTVLVVSSNSTPRRIATDVLQSLKRTEVPLLGIVLNRVDTSGKGSGYYGYGAYGYGHYGNYGQYGGGNK